MKRYLAVGINEYQGQPLAGCVNDARDWSDALTERGFVGTILTDGEATRAAITAELRDMIATAKRGDSLVFQFSGHGTWVPDRDGDEADFRDEAIVPADYADAGLITDDLIHRIVTDNRGDGVKVLIVGDSCHSGTLSRFLGANDRHAIGVEPDMNVVSTRRQPIPREMDEGVVPLAVKYLPPVNFLPPEQLRAAERVQFKPMRGAPRTSAALFSACRDNQVAYDASFANRPNGAFSYAALRALSATAPCSLKAWLGATRGFLTFDQDPQIGGTWWQRNVSRFV